MSNDASEAWTLLFRLFVSQRGRVPQVASEFELSPMQAHVLRLLEPEEPLPMRTLARKLCCDASNVTGIVDRLEERGLVRRAAAPGDRRVKMLVVTDRGLGIRTAILARLSEAPEPIASLSAADQRALREILARALDQGPVA
jgi:MarR family transcriptional regulator, organic hydroperoxide resistance regulator